MTYLIGVISINRCSYPMRLTLWNEFATNKGAAIKENLDVGLVLVARNLISNSYRSKYKYILMHFIFLVITISCL